MAPAAKMSGTKLMMLQNVKFVDTLCLKHKYGFHIKPNITTEEARAFKELRQDKDRVILTAEKGVAMGDIQQAGPLSAKGHI